MSASPTRMAAASTPPPLADLGLPLADGNRVLEAIAQQQVLGSLLTFSALHDQIHNRQTAYSLRHPEWDLGRTENFVRDEVLQLICDRIQSITQADGVMIALAEGDAMVCRAASGALLVERGVRLPGDSEFLQQCLYAGQIARSDDCPHDPRVAHDLASELGAGATVLVPLRGRRARIGVLQIFSALVSGFTEDDIRCLDLFAELILSALKPADEDRRLNWLAEVADEILRGKTPGPTPPSTPVAAEVPAAEIAPQPPPAAQVLAIPAIVEPAPAKSAFVEIPPSPAHEEPAIEKPAKVAAAEPSPALATLPRIDIPPTFVETLPAPELPADQPAPANDTRFEPILSGPLGLVVGPSLEAEPPAIDAFVAEASETDLHRVDHHFSFELARTDEGSPSLQTWFASARGTRPGLSVVAVVVLVAALFSVGVWWGMRNHAASSRAAQRSSEPEAPLPSQPSASLLPVSAPASSIPAAPDNLMDPIKLDSPSEPLSPASASQLAAFPKITAVRHWSSALVSTVAIDMQDQVPYEVHRLTSPERIYFDLHDSALLAELQGKNIEVGDPALRRIRVAQPVAGITRVVLDTRDGSNFSVSMESNPYRLVVQLRGSAERTPLVARATPPVAFEHSAAKQAALSALPLPVKPEPKLENEPIPAKTGRVRIVVDAGHGGWDLGTVGRQGLLEKDLVLDVSERLGKLLKNRLGAEVVFTRTDDTYLPLHQRAEVANQMQADLFVSVHANYSSFASARGVETYYSNFYAPPATPELDKPDTTTAHLVRTALAPAELHEKIEESRSLAANVQHALFGTLAATNPGIRDRGIKDAAFVVLKGTTMPSILTEISFVSSPTDERHLKSEAYRQQIAEALYKGIARYESNAHKVKLAQVQAKSAGR